MRIIPTKIHGILDYVVGLLLIASPWLFNFDKEGAETWVPVILGASALLYSLFTRYELGLIRKIPMTVHLTLDILSGIVLAISPWLFNFDERIFLPHLILGIFEILAGLLTAKEPGLMVVEHNDSLFKRGQASHR
jgi:hypothetical protein